ncbi:UrcA family protein [Sphingomonas sp. KR3-1]|uniref:UrcA family protein n=1 Tax=Sphingomonas sp. KR3-1 TaxID=3156611 RepID=UPI0032B57CD3
MFRTLLFTTLAFGLAAPALGRPFDDPQPVSRTVSVRDLNLATDAGARELDRRIQAAARFVCRIPNPSLAIPFVYSRPCVAEALRDVAPRVANAVALARSNQLRMSAIQVSTR